MTLKFQRTILEREQKFTNKRHLLFRKTTISGYLLIISQNGQLFPNFGHIRTEYTEGRKDITYGKKFVPNSQHWRIAVDMVVSTASKCLKYLFLYFLCSVIESINIINLYWFNTKSQKIPFFFKVETFSRF